MSLDRLAGAAARELLEQPPADSAWMLEELKRTRRKRTLARYATAATAVLLVAGSWTLLQSDDDRPEPAPPTGVRNGAVVVAVDDSHLPWSTFDAIESDLELPQDAANFPHAQFTRDGRRLVYPGKGRLIRTVDVTNGDTTTLGQCLDELCRPALSPDGTELAYGAKGHLKIQSIETNEVRPVHTPGVEDAWLPTWSPDGSALAFTGLRALYTVDVKSEMVHEVFHYSTRIADFIAPAWSPDGRQIAFVDQRPRSAPGSVPHRFLVLMVVNSDGTSPRELHAAGHCFCAGVPAPSVAWSPDGEQIAVSVSNSRLEQGVYTVRPDGTRWELMYPGIYGDVTWQPLPD